MEELTGTVRTLMVYILTTLGLGGLHFTFFLRFLVRNYFALNEELIPINCVSKIPPLLLKLLLWLPF